MHILYIDFHLPHKMKWIIDGYTLSNLHWTNNMSVDSQSLDLVQNVLSEIVH